MVLFCYLSDSDGVSYYACSFWQVFLLYKEALLPRFTLEMTYTTDYRGLQM